MQQHKDDQSTNIWKFWDDHRDADSRCFAPSTVFFTRAFGHLGSTLPEPFFTWAFAFGHTTWDHKHWHTTWVGRRFFLTERAERALPNYPDQMIMPSDIKRKDICCTSPHPPIFWRSRLVLVKYQNPAVPHPKREISDPRRTVLITSTPLPCFNTTTHQIWILNLFLNNNTSPFGNILGDITNVFVHLYLCIWVFVFVYF